MAVAYSTRLCGAQNPNFRHASERSCIACGTSFHSYHKERKYCGQPCYQASVVVRGRARKDANHVAIVTVLEQCGAFVRDLSALGRGAPDLLVWAQNSWQLAEVKNPETWYGRRGLSRLQSEWADEWRGGPVFILRTSDDAVNLARGKWSLIESRGGGVLQGSQE